MTLLQRLRLATAALREYPGNAGAEKALIEAAEEVVELWEWARKPITDVNKPLVPRRS